MRPNRTVVPLIVALALSVAPAAPASDHDAEGMGAPPVPFLHQLRPARGMRALSAGTLGALPRAITPPGYYDLSVAGDVSLGGAIFRNGYPFIHQDGGVYNTAVGTDALISLTSGYYNVAFGYRALRDNQSGFGNTAVGGVALLYNTTGSGNTAIGDMTLRQNLTGSGNIGIGQYALVSNVGGNGNTAVGYSAALYTASGSGNTAIGREALRYNTTGAGRQTAVGYRAAFRNYNQENTAVGAYALYNNATGRNNVAIGSYSLYFSVSGDDNIALGRRAGQAVSGASSRNIFIGNEGAMGVENDTIRIGSTQGRAFLAGVAGVTTDVDDAMPVLVSSEGQLGTMSSSRRYKEKIRDMERASEPLLELRPVTFRFKRSFANGERPIQFGLIAEEVAEVFPELVTYDDAGRPETVKYHLLSVLLLNELQEERRAGAERDRRLAELERMVEGLASRRLR